jgi:hypothetical protein
MADGERRRPTVQDGHAGRRTHRRPSHRRAGQTTESQTSESQTSESQTSESSESRTTEHKRPSQSKSGDRHLVDPPVRAEAPCCTSGSGSPKVGQSACAAPRRSHPWWRPKSARGNLSHFAPGLRAGAPKPLGILAGARPSRRREVFPSTAFGAGGSDEQPPGGRTGSPPIAVPRGTQPPLGPSASRATRASGVCCVGRDGGGACAAPRRSHPWWRPKSARGNLSHFAPGLRAGAPKPLGILAGARPSRRREVFPSTAFGAGGSDEQPPGGRTGSPPIAVPRGETAAAVTAVTAAAVVPSGGSASGGGGDSGGGHRASRFGVCRTSLGEHYLRAARGES